MSIIGSIIGSIIFVVFLLVFIGGFVFVIMFSIKQITQLSALNKKKQKEEKLYEIMILNPSDTTVSNYIKIFLEASDIPKTLRMSGYDSLNSGKSIENKSRQAQGYQIIMQSQNVSEEVKQQLTNAFMAKGVPIQPYTIQAEINL